MANTILIRFRSVRKWYHLNGCPSKFCGSTLAGDWKSRPPLASSKADLRRLVLNLRRQVLLLLLPRSVQSPGCKNLTDTPSQ